MEVLRNVSGDWKICGKVKGILIEEQILEGS
jgi:hypothetical protein